MTTLTRPQTSSQRTVQQPLTLDDRITIAKVLSWDCCETIHPEQIVTIWMEGDIAWIKLDKGCVPIHKETFKDILAAQREIEENGDDREPIETQTHQGQLLTLVPVENVPHAYKVCLADEFLGFTYRSLLLGGWSNDKCQSSFADPFDAAERLLVDWDVEQEIGSEIAALLY